MTKVLIIEDDEFLQGLEAKKMINSGFEVISAQTGDDAIDKIKEPGISIILLDLVLPNFNGFEILQKIKEGDKTKDIPVIVFSNMASEENAKKAIKMGASKFMIKSNFSLSELMDEINKLI